MLRRASLTCSSLYRLLLLLLLASPVFANAQNLTFTPVVVSFCAGNTTGTAPGPSGANYTGPISGLVPGSYGGAMAFDSAGNLYMVDSGNAILRVVAASSTPIPILPGVAVQAGHVYTVAGTTNASTGSIP